MSSPARTGVVALAALVSAGVGCVETEPSGAPLSAVREVEAPASDRQNAGPAPSAAPPAPQGDFDFEAEDRPEPAGAEAGPAAVALDPNELQAKATNIEPQPAAPDTWDPTQPLPGTSFGIRLLAVILDVQPPRAVIGLPDGREEVVQPGALLPELGLVVMAIGRDAVQVAHVTPQGFYAKIDTETIRALYPSATTSP